MNIKRAGKELLRRIKGESHFNKNNPLGDNGERVDIQIKDGVKYEKLDMYQKSHYKRYEFAYDLINAGDICGDFACGTGYGSILMAKKAAKVIGGDINDKVIREIKKRYKNIENVEFVSANVLNLDYTNYFDDIISFETLEHLEEEDLKKVIGIYSRALKLGGKFIFSTPYMQERTEDAVKMGFHLTFLIDEHKIKSWLNAEGLELQEIFYQNYDTHAIQKDLSKKDFLICYAIKK